jgi:ribose transport system substrate-binding protein
MAIHFKLRRVGVVMGVTVVSTLTGISFAAASSVKSIPYTGPEKGIASTYGSPKPKAGVTCTIGYMQLYAEQLSLSAQQAGAQTEAKRLGCRITVLNDNLTLTTQVNDFAQLLAQKVNAIIVYPLVPSGLQPSITQANAAHIPVVAFETPVDPGQPAPSGYATSVLQGFDNAAYARAKQVSQASPGAAFVVQGLAAPVASLTYFATREKYWGSRFGLKYLGEVDQQADTPAGAATAMTSILARYPTVKAIFTYNDDNAAADASVVRTSGHARVLISGLTGAPEAFPLIKSGGMFDTYEPNWKMAGRLAVDAAYDLITKQHLPLPRLSIISGVLIDKANVNSVAPANNK